MCEYFLVVKYLKQNEISFEFPVSIPLSQPKFTCFKSAVNTRAHILNLDDLIFLLVYLSKK